MSPTPASGFFGGVGRGFQASSNYAAAQQRAAEKLREHMRLVKNDETALQNQIGDDAMALIKEFQTATPETMSSIQERMQYMVDTTEDKSMLPVEFFDGSYGLRVDPRVAKAMVPVPDATGFESLGPEQVQPAADPGSTTPSRLLGAPDSASPAPKGTVQGPGLSGSAIGGNTKSAKAYQKLMSKRQRAVNQVVAGGATPSWVIYGFGSQKAYERDAFQKQSHLEMVNILTNGGKTSASDALRDQERWAGAKDQFYIKAQQMGMDDKDAKAIVDRFEKDRELAVAGQDTMSDQIRQLTDEMDTFFNKMFGMDGGVLEIAQKLEGDERAAFLGATKWGLQSIIERPDQSAAELRLGLFSILDKISQINKTEDGSGYVFDVAQTTTGPNAKPIHPSGQPDYVNTAIENLPPGAVWTQQSDGVEILSIPDPNGDLIFITGKEEIARIGEEQKESRRLVEESIRAHNQRMVEMEKKAKKEAEAQKNDVEKLGIYKPFGISVPPLPMPTPTDTSPTDIDPRLVAPPRKKTFIDLLYGG